MKTIRFLVPLLLLSPLLADDFDAFREGSAEQRGRLAKIEGKTAPDFKLADWIGSDPKTLADLKGKIVVLDFWATWCGPCIASIPKNNELAAKYADDVVFIGVCHPRGAEKMAATVKNKGIKYPVAADPDGKAGNAYKVNGYPDYYIIGRDGKLLVADCANSKVGDVLKVLVGKK